MYIPNISLIDSRMWAGVASLGGGVWPLPGEVLTLSPTAVIRERKVFAHLVERARYLRNLQLHVSDERIVPPHPTALPEADISGLAVGQQDEAATRMSRFVYNATSQYGESAGGYLGRTDCYMILAPTRRKEIDQIQSMRRGDVVLLTDSSKSPTGARLAGVALMLGYETEPDGTVYVYCKPLKRFDVRLRTEKGRRPVRLRGNDSGFGGSFSSQPVVTPCTASDLLGLQEALDWPSGVLAADLDERLAALFGWANTVDQNVVADRWAAQATEYGPTSPRRVLLGSAACLIGRAGEVVVSHLLQARLSGVTVEDVSSQPGMGYDLAIRRNGRDLLRVEVKTTASQVADPATWIRRIDLQPSQRQAAITSLERGEVPWMVAVVGDVLDTPQVSFHSPAAVLPDLAAGPDQEVA